MSERLVRVLIKDYELKSYLGSDFVYARDLFVTGYGA
jgi:hypothetical protein